MCYSTLLHHLPNNLFFLTTKKYIILCACNVEKRAKVHYASFFNAPCDTFCSMFLAMQIHAVKDTDGHIK